MERLTDYSDDECTYIIGVGNKTCEEFCKYVVDGCRNCYIQQVFKKLAEYEDLEEQGLLVRLPCNVGDDLYCIVNGEVKKLKVHSFGVPDFEITDIEFKYVDGFKIVRFVGEVGKTVFLTREEAEKKLEEMKNESKRCDKGNKTR